MAEPAHAVPASAPRLKFIDLARSVAILLMLEGHFVGLTLMDEYRQPDHPGYVIWNSLRGVAAPLFFTVAGLVFVYLLTGNQEQRFFDKPRVRKGLKRALLLLFWGYALQLSLRNLPSYLRGDFPAWVSAFHVLQSIGMGLVALIAVFGIRQLLGRVPLSVCYLVVGTAILRFYSYLQQLPDGTYFPAEAPMLIQNWFRGPHSVFPLAPWLAFAMYGGAIGAMVRRYRAHVASPWFTAAFFAAGIVFKLIGWSAHAYGQWYPAAEIAANGHAWFYGRSSEILFILGVLLIVEHRLKVKDSWFMRVGKHTFPIYVIHVIILYGGLFGIGLVHLWKNAFTPLQAGVGAFIFMAFFVLLVPYFDSLAGGWERLRARGFGRLVPPPNR